ncbi:hypothetical protein AB0E83_10700 [Streptomyces sp. NPDC035033]|uniref:hypothetical protein n=1 Tax=Streptomyces sp. NPDC035033 TaxID=3155368 RepID=UPI0033DB1E34
MADERYQWLDPEAAERLLRGEPVDPVDPAARARAAALAEALDAARVPAVPAVPAPGVPLAGEEAALAAFRTATAARASAAAAPDAVPADLGRVRLAPAPGTARHWGRSLRYGLAAAFAAVTVGGVAVAAGTGVLPLVDREPSRTVTAAETASPDPRDPSAGPSFDAERHADPHRSAGPGRSAGTPAPGTTPTAPSGGGSTASPRPGATPSGDRTGRGPAEPSATSRTGGDEGRVKACREYRAGRLDATARRQLSGALRSGETLRAYCDALLGTGPAGSTGQDDPAGSGSGTGGQPGGGTADDGKGDTKDDDGKEDEENGPGTVHGTVPAPADSGRKRAQAPRRGDGGDKDRTGDRSGERPRAEAAAGTEPGTEPGTGSGTGGETGAGSGTGSSVRALALCPTGAPAPGV